MEPQTNTMSNNMLDQLLTSEVKIAKYAPLAGYCITGLGLSIIFNLLPAFGLVALYAGLSVMGGIILGLVIGLNETKADSSSIPTIISLVILGLFFLGFLIVSC